MPPPIPLSGAAAWYSAGSQSGSASSSANRGRRASQACSGEETAAIVAWTSSTNARTTGVPRTNSSFTAPILLDKPQSGEVVGAASRRSHRSFPYLFFLTAKMPVPLVWVAIAVWSQVELLLVVASQPLEFGAPAWYWSSL